MTDATLDISGTFLVPKGKLTAAVTWLGMAKAPEPAASPGPLRLNRIAAPDLAWYRALFRRVGEDWLWTSRLILSDAALADILGNPRVEVYTIERDGAEIGMVELDLRVEAEVEIVYFGLAREAVGQGLGRMAMASALQVAWRPGITKVWLHTCSHDHPGALKFYRSCGFVPYATGIEIFDDPRLAGLLPRSAAAHIPLIG
ncbi:GNAT family N-acetyltransferase [Phreatobacter stygius]|uniref:GNAT family N-acetyltransferase n=1 Tax=Phreatobacter stygius TaxID=1940610 RepID=A0A4D7B065_9HYPH|nr:GNAT family N-acetyltransferase [Phreatobacter stygius]QCI64228.1 GNAT family N-acetyltransferase [Phreatobacter stygius]